MSTTDITTLTPAEVGALTPAELAAYTAEELADLTASQAACLTAEQLTALSAEQLTAIGPAMQTCQDSISAYQEAQSATAAAARAAFLEPLTDIIASDEYSTVKAAVAALGDSYTAEPFAASLNCLRTGLRNLVVS